MTTKNLAQALRADTFELLARIREEVEGIAPKQAIELTPGDTFILSLFWRSLRLFNGIVVLLENNLPEEALILGRSQFVDALRLAQIRDAGSDRRALVLDWANASIEEKKGLFKEAARVGLEKDLDTLLEKLDEEQRKLQNYRIRVGAGPLKKFVSEKIAAERYGRSYDYWTYLFSHEFVHGSDAAFAYSRRKQGENLIVMAGRTSNPEIISTVACFGANSLLQAATATAGVFGWSGSERLKALESDVEALGQRRVSGD